MICFPNCKINLGLSVLEKRLDGFHNVETIMYPVKKYDVLEIIKSTDKIFSFSSTGNKIDEDWRKNLVVKAYKLLDQDFGLGGVKIHLHKSIPMGAGLGGGSADAAFAIKLLNDLFNLKLSFEQMKDYAAKLGSDCAFFIKNEPVFAYGRGEIFENINIDLSNYHMVIVKPDIHISTPEAYSLIKPEIKEISVKEIIQFPIREWKEMLLNDFEEVIFNKHPEIQLIKESLYKSGAIYASMTGSGAAVYGIFEEPIRVDNFKNHCVWMSY